ncbi:MAG: serine/threonine protein kinase [Deltaproteobacteria bacterium]|nr:serine/threonine protein kinase [Deltaproteobacteria bacterium]
MINESFYALTPDMVIQTLEKSGLQPTGHIMTLNSYENRVYDLKLSDDTHVVTKFYRPGRWSQEQIMEEHNFLFELQSEEIPVCAPLKFSDGSTVHETSGIFYAVWPRTGGRSKFELNDEEMEVLGRYLARIHNVGAAQKANHRIELNTETYARNPLRYLLDNNFIPLHLAKRYEETVYGISEIYDVLSKDIPVHRIHGDCHLGNLLCGSHGWFFLDFDDFLTGVPVQDIWMISGDRDEYGKRQQRILIEAYRQFRDFKESWLNLIEPLRGLRFIHYSAWIARRWEDPAFQKAFINFGTTDYWEKETVDLEKQLLHIRENVQSLPFSLKHEAVEEEKELTNKDFFWDMDD